MQETRQTNDTIFQLRTYGQGGGWKWEVTRVPIGVDAAEQTIYGVSHEPFLYESEAFTDGLRHLDGLVAGPARHAASPSAEG